MEFTTVPLLDESASVVGEAAIDVDAGDVIVRFHPGLARRVNEEFGPITSYSIKLNHNGTPRYVGVICQGSTSVEAAKDPNNEAVNELVGALIHTMEYLGERMLPAIEGWSWFDALKKYAPQEAQNFVDRYNRVQELGQEGPSQEVSFEGDKEVGLDDASPESNLVIHARRELEVIGEDRQTIEGYLRVIQAFADMGHSGGSASIAIPVINELLQFKNLSDLTNDPDEWIRHNEGTWGSPGGIYQNKRNAEAFSNNGGRTYYLLSEIQHKEGSEDRLYTLHTAKDVRSRSTAYGLRADDE